MMRIAIDAHAIGSRLTGNERYAENLIDQLLQLDTQNEYLLFFTHEKTRVRWAKRAPNAMALPISRNPIWRLGADFAAQLRKLRADVFHYQYTGPLISACPEVVTVHDVSFERHPGYFSPTERYRLKITVKRAVKRAKKIITVSEFSKSEILHFYDVEQSKIEVIHNGAGNDFEVGAEPDEIEQRLERYGVRQPYILSVGNVSRRKNHRTAVSGFARWLSSRPESQHAFVIAGNPKDGITEVMAEMAKANLNSRRVKILGYMPEGDLPYLYAGAEALLNTSYYEGFGLPLIEAMRAGVPVVASRASCFPEIVGDAGRLVNADDPDEVAQALEDVLGNPDLRTALICRGRKRAAQFRWDVAARETLNVYYQASRRA